MAAYHAQRANGNSKRKRRIYHRRKVCRFCADSKLSIDYKDQKQLNILSRSVVKLSPGEFPERVQSISAP